MTIIMYISNHVERNDNPLYLEGNGLKVQGIPPA